MGPSNILSPVLYEGFSDFVSFSFLFSTQESVDSLVCTDILDFLIAAPTLPVPFSSRILDVKMV